MIKSEKSNELLPSPKQQTNHTKDDEIYIKEKYQRLPVIWAPKK